MEVEATAKKWGSSIGIIIPKEAVDKEGIRPNDRVRVRVSKTPLARTLWELGPLKRKESTQKAKDEIRELWE